MKHSLAAAFFAMILLFAGPGRAANISATVDGMAVDCGAMGTFTINYPTFFGAKGWEESHKVIDRQTAGATATVKYEGGATVQIEAAPDGKITYSFANVPDDVKGWKLRMMVGFDFAQGGTWQIGKGPVTSFPVQQPPDPHLYQGNATTMLLMNPQGQSLSLNIPDFSYQELNDNRAWHWAIFAWSSTTPYNRDIKTYTVTVTADTADKKGPSVDAFGQTKAKDWPGKVHSPDDLANDVKEEQAYYAGLAKDEPPHDKYGGLAGTKEKYGLAATGFFHVQEWKTGKSILVDPDGNAFFQLGICGFSPGDDFTLVGGRKSTYEWLPAEDDPQFKTAWLPNVGGGVFSFYLANVIRKYGKPYDLENFQGRMIPRVKAFGFNSIGAFSPYTKAARAVNFPYVTHLPLDEWTGHIPRLPGITETWDPFDENNQKRVEQNFAGVIVQQKDDPLLIGYFLANEPIYEDIPKMVPSYKASEHACKQALVNLLVAKYRRIESFNKAWDASARSFDELRETPLEVKTLMATADMHDFTGEFFDTYYGLVSAAFHKYDPHHLLLGNRFQPGTINNEQLCRIAGKYLDVMSFNYYTDGVDTNLLNRIHYWTGRPMLMSEFYWASPKESGLIGGGQDLTQRERGLAYRNYVEQTASLGYVVGIEWFILLDQATTGRWFQKYNGERANTGLFSVADRPWKPTVEEMKKTNDTIYGIWLGGKKPYLFDNPKFNPH